MSWLPVIQDLLHSIIEFIQDKVPEIFSSLVVGIQNLVLAIQKLLHSTMVSAALGGVANLASGLVAQIQVVLSSIVARFDIRESAVILSGFLSPLIAILTIYIAFQQYQTNRNKLRFDLYERRFRVFEALTSFISHVNHENRIDPKQLSEFRASINHAPFLFSRETVKYLERLEDNATTLYVQQIQRSKLEVVEQEEQEKKEGSQLVNVDQSSEEIGNDNVQLIRASKINHFPWVNHRRQRAIEIEDVDPVIHRLLEWFSQQDKYAQKIFAKYLKLED